MTKIDAKIATTSARRRAEAQARANEFLEQLVRDYGAKEAKLLWNAAARAVPTRRGRPPGTRDKNDNFDPRRALQGVDYIASLPEYSGLTSWQVVRLAAEIMTDWDVEKVASKKSTVSAESRISSIAGSRTAQAKLRKSKIEALHKRLERELDKRDRGLPG